VTEETNVADLKEEALELIELTLGDGQESGRAVLLGQILQVLLGKTPDTCESRVAPVTFWYAWNASVASNNKVVPDITTSDLRKAYYGYERIIYRYQRCHWCC
jgi:hypothetical protein